MEVAHSNILWTEPRDLAIESVDKLVHRTTSSLVTHHERGPRFASLEHLIILSRAAPRDPESKLLRELLTDGMAFSRLQEDWIH